MKYCNVAHRCHPILFTLRCLVYGWCLQLPVVPIPGSQSLHLFTRINHGREQTITFYQKLGFHTSRDHSTMNLERSNSFAEQKLNFRVWHESCSQHNNGQIVSTPLRDQKKLTADKISNNTRGFEAGGVIGAVIGQFYYFYCIEQFIHHFHHGDSVMKIYFWSDLISSPTNLCKAGVMRHPAPCTKPISSPAFFVLAMRK